MTQTEIIELVKEIQKGNKIAETKLYKGLHSFVYLICYNYIKNKEDAEDLTNESFVKIFRSIDTYESKYTFLTWVGTITKNNCLNLMPPTINIVTVTPTTQIVIDILGSKRRRCL